MLKIKAGDNMKTKRARTAACCLVIIIILLSLVVLKRSKEQTDYDNLFEYAINLSGGSYTYAPKQIDYGMSVQDVLEITKLSEDTFVEEWMTIISQRELSNVSEEFDEVGFREKYVFTEEHGLVSVEYAVIVDDVDFEPLCYMLYEQAVAYMPEPQNSDVEFIKDAKQVQWDDSVFDEKNGWSTAQTCVSLSFGDAENEKKAVSMMVYLDPLYVKNIQQSDENINFFKYMINLDHSNYAFAVNGLEYGMTPEEILESENLTEKNMYTDGRVIITENTYENVPFGSDGETIDTLKVEKRYTCDDEIGFGGACYILYMDPVYEEAMRELLYEQALEYMPEANDHYADIEKIKTESVIGWSDIKNNSFDLSGKDISDETYCTIKIWVNKEGLFEVSLVCGIDGRGLE